MISIIDNYDLRASKPDFQRQLFNTIEEMVAYPENYLPDVYECNVVENSCRYRFSRSNSDDTVSGLKKWRLVDNSGTASLIDYYKKNEVDGFLDTKVDKEDGKGLSTNDFTTLEKEKLATLENYDDSAISERVGNVETSVTDIQTSIGNAVLNTEKQTITEAINEVKTNCDTKNAEVLAKATANEEAIAIINGDSTVSGSIKRSAFNTLKDSKAYTDQKIAEMASEQAIVADEIPQYSNGITTYIKGGEVLTTDEENIWFYYEQDGKLMQTIFINGENITIVSAGSVNFQDFVSKTNDVVSTYDGNEADTSKIGDLGALQALETKLQTNIDTKITGGIVVDNLEDTSAVNVLSANQGRLLNEKVNEKLDKVFVGDDIANKHLVTDSIGNIKLGSYDETITSDSSNAVQAKAIRAELDTKFDKVQDVANANKVLSVMEDGTIGFTTATDLGGTAEKVAYENDMYFTDVTNLKQAIDKMCAKLYYEALEITSFTCSASDTYEIGTVLEDGIEFNWTYNKEVASQALTDCNIVIDDRSCVYENSLSASKTFVLTASDNTTVKTASKKISFLYPIYYGCCAEVEEYNNDFILALENKKLVTNNKSTYNFICGDGEFAYFATPTTMKISSAWVNGFQSDVEEVATVSHQNSSGHTSSYTISRFRNSGLGSFVAEVK